MAGELQGMCELAFMITGDFAACGKAAEAWK
jgi:hypothetical protein